MLRQLFFFIFIPKDELILASFNWFYMLGVSLKIRVTKILHHETDVNENFPKLRTVHKASSYKHPATRPQGRAEGVRWCVNHSHFGSKYTQCTSNSAGIAKLLSVNTILPCRFTKILLTLYSLTMWNKLYWIGGHIFIGPFNNLQNHRRPGVNEFNEYSSSFRSLIISVQ